MSVARRKSEPKQDNLPMAPREGVHLGLPDTMYFDARALGSSDFHILATDTPSWWFASPFNPERKEKMRKSWALAFGSALHTLILEGEEAYERRFVVEPDRDSNRYMKTREAILQRLKDVGYKPIPRGSASFGKELFAAAARAGIAGDVWEMVNAGYQKAKQRGQSFVTEDENRRLRRMAYLVSQHADLGPNLRAGLSEVTVFWRRPERPEILLRARFDKLLPGVVVDLKSFANERDKTPEEATEDAIVNHGYDLQAEHYINEALVRLIEFVKTGRVYSWEVEGERVTRQEIVAREKKVLEDIVAAKVWIWVWIFYQVQSDDAGRERAPIVVPWSLERADPLFVEARPVIEAALSNYALWVDRCGTAQPWSDIRPILSMKTDRLRKRLSYKRSTT